MVPGAGPEPALRYPSQQNGPKYALMTGNVRFHA
jgi:hypothetical protein